MKGSVLVVLVAGIGSRYGGLKQVDRIGKSGETMLDYSVYDAFRSNFQKVVSYRLDKTLSPQGSVARGVCGIENGYLVSVEELTAISQRDGRIFNTAPDGTERDLAPDTPVSMNFWGFPLEAISHIRRYFEKFLKTSVGDPKRECYIPRTVDWLIKNKTLSFKALNAGADWFGVIYKEDKASTTARVAELVARSVYPASLWA
ncbi:MAG: hypothetical protein LBD79_08180 [Treponema sp.]|jgi:hypothetical protein|nr:hypothetical protein [Treponema sp.]